MTAELVVQLETALPASLPVGAATAVFVFGTCPQPLERLDITVDGRHHAPAALGMPRHGAFWGTVPVPARAAPGAVELGVVARLPGGAEASAPLGRIEIVGAQPAGQRGAPGQIAICMATFEPDIELFRAQVESLRAQTDTNWVCVISDDGSRPEYLAAIQLRAGAVARSGGHRIGGAMRSGRPLAPR
jgi:hypothetical protein